MYWLVRAAPAHLLRLQNGRYPKHRLVVMTMSIGRHQEMCSRLPVVLSSMLMAFCVFVTGQS